MRVLLGTESGQQLAAAFGVDSSNAALPSFRLATLDGRSISSGELRGSVVLVNFWATWCPPCRLEMPGFQTTYDRKKADGFVVLGISADAGGPDGVKRFLADRGITYPVAMASGALAQRLGGVNLLPTSFLIDRQGRIRHEVRGIFASAALERGVDRLLSESASVVPQSAVRGPGGNP